jgi:hypothetical protein
MAQISLHWYLPTHGDGRTLTQASASAQSLNMDGSGRGASIEAAAKSVLAGAR